MKLHKKEVRRHIHNRILSQLGIAAVVALAMSLWVIKDAINGQISISFILLGLLIGFIAGYFFGRIYSLSWHKETEKVVLNMDKTSFLLIGVYIAFRLFDKAFFGQFIQGEALTAFSFITISGILLGRIYVLWTNISKILRREKGL